MSKVVRLSDKTLEHVEELREILKRPESYTISDIADYLSVDDLINIALNRVIALDKKKNT